MRARTAIAVFLTGFLLLGCAALRSNYSVPVRHPEDVSGKPTCSGCHDASSGSDYRRFDHTVYFGENHRNQARQAERLCSMCHEQSYCNRCHNVQTTEFQLGSPHRGDYLTRHRIDGRVDPTSCFRCHGNPKASKLCAQCHGR